MHVKHLTFPVHAGMAPVFPVYAGMARCQYFTHVFIVSIGRLCIGLSLYEKLIKPRIIDVASGRRLLSCAFGMLFLALGGFTIAFDTTVLSFFRSGLSAVIAFVTGVIMTPFAVGAFAMSLMLFVARNYSKSMGNRLGFYADDEPVEYEVLPVEGVSDGSSYVEKYFKVGGGKLWVSVSEDGEVKSLPIAPLFSKGALDRVDSVRTVYDALEGSAPRLKVVFGEWEADRRYLHYEVHVPRSEKKAVKDLIRSVHDEVRGERYDAAISDFGKNGVTRLIDEPIRRPNNTDLGGEINLPVALTDAGAIYAVLLAMDAILLSIAATVLYCFAFFAHALPMWLIVASGILTLLMFLFTVGFARAKRGNAWINAWDYSSLQFKVLPFTGLDADNPALDDYFKKCEDGTYVLLEEADYELMGTYKLPANATVKYTLEDFESPMCLIEGNEGEEDEDEGIDGKITEFCLYFPKRLTPSSSNEPELN